MGEGKNKVPKLCNCGKYEVIKMRGEIAFRSIIKVHDEKNLRDE